jgi:heme-binding protein
MTPTARRVVAGLVGAGAAAAVLAAAPTAIADPPPPNCTAADLAGIATGVTASTSTYLFTHPDVNAFYTGLEGQSRETIVAKQKEYLAANPQVKAEITAIRQPMIDAKLRCGSTPESLGLEPAG